MQGFEGQGGKFKPYCCSTILSLTLERLKMSMVTDPILVQYISKFYAAVRCMAHFNNLATCAPIVCRNVLSMARMYEPI